MTESHSRRTRVFLIALLILLLVGLCGLLWVYRAFMQSPERQIVESGAPGVGFEFAAYNIESGEGFEGRMPKPACVAWDGRDRIYVTYPEEHMVAVFDDDGQNGRVFLSEDMTRQERKSLSEYAVIGPLGIDVDTNGDVYIASPKKASVGVFSADGVRLREIPAMNPRYVKVDESKIYVVNDGTLTVYDKEGNVLGRWGTYGRGVEQLAYPAGLTIAPDGTILIADTNNYRLIALTPELDTKWVYGQAATTRTEQDKRDLAAPMGVARDEAGDLYVVDALNSHIRAFTGKGVPYAGWMGERGEKDDQFQFPVGIDYMEDGLFVVADRANQRIVGVRLTHDVEYKESESQEPAEESTSSQ